MRRDRSGEVTTEWGVSAEENRIDRVTEKKNHDPPEEEKIHLYLVVSGTKRETPGGDKDIQDISATRTLYTIGGYLAQPPDGGRRRGALS